MEKICNEILKYFKISIKCLLLKVVIVIISLPCNLSYKNINSSNGCLSCFAIIAGPIRNVLLPVQISNYSSLFFLSKFFIFPHHLKPLFTT